MSRSQAMDMVREVVLDALRERGPDRQEEGIDEWSDAEYGALVDAVREVYGLDRCIACGNLFSDPQYGAGEFGFCRPCYEGRRELAFDAIREWLFSSTERSLGQAFSEAIVLIAMREFVHQ